MKIQKKIVIVILTVLIIYLAFVIISYLLLKKKLHVRYVNIKFDISAIINIDKCRITSESEVFKDNMLIEYNCKIDSTCCLTVIKLCDTYNLNYIETIHLAKFPFPSRIGYVNTSIISAHPIINFLESSHIPFYNINLLPFKNISKIELYVDGNILNKVCDSVRNILIYNIFGKGISFSFNEINKNDLMFSSSKNQQLITLFFFIYEKKLYTGLLSTLKGEEMTLEQIEKYKPVIVQ
jgi:hypothetical protein